MVFGDAGYLELKMAEPSPIMLGASKLWRRITFSIKTFVVLSVLGAYPAMMVTSHAIDDRQVSLDQAMPWAVPEAGVAVTLIAREIRGPGWAADRAPWHPQAQLTAMPAWQSALAEALADHTAMSAALIAEAGAPDSDLEAAARLMRIDDDLYIEPRLAAAAEALARYDGRAARGLATRIQGGGALAEELRLFAGWAESSNMTLVAQSGDAAEWPATDSDIAAFYTAKARAHAAHELLFASARAEPKLMANATLRAEVRKVQDLWRRAATQKPLFVYNRGQDNLLMANHLTGMAYLMDEAAAASHALADALETPESSTYMAELAPREMASLP